MFAQGARDAPANLKKNAENEYGDVVALHAHCTHLPGNSPKITWHLSASKAKQQSPQDNNKTAFKLELQCTYGQTTQCCNVQLCSGMQDTHMFKRQVPHSDISPRRWPHNWQQTLSSFFLFLNGCLLLCPHNTQAHEAKVKKPQYGTNNLSKTRVRVFADVQTFALRAQHSL